MFARLAQLGFFQKPTQHTQPANRQLSTSQQGDEPSNYSFNQDELKQSCRLATQRLREKYPHLLSMAFNGKVAYTLQRISPDEMKQQGGFISYDSFLWFSNKGTGDNAGSVCLSFLPEVAAIFARKALQKKNPSRAYLYALPLYGTLLLPGGAWRQVISPGALTVENSYWMAREIDRIDCHGRVYLGPPEGDLGEVAPIHQGERFDEYANNLLELPKEMDNAEDFPCAYDIEDTDFTREIQRLTADHYNPYRQTFGNRS